MSKIPYPPPPEVGCYDDDVPAAQGQETAIADHHEHDIADNAVYRPEYQLEYSPQDGAQGSEEWDGTVLSTEFMSRETKHDYRLVNETTRQEILLDKSVLLGRKPSQDIPDGAKAVTILDPTRTVSRNHAAISFDQDRTMWIEDYGSLNGTFVLRDDGETKVDKGTPVRLEVLSTIRIGDQFFQLEEDDA